MTKDTEIDHARQQACAQLNSICEMVKAFQCEAEARANGESNSEEAQQQIQDDPLSIEVRTGWFNPCSLNEKGEAEEFNILLCTGGPACRLVGKLDGFMQPESVQLQYQDWGTPWTTYHLNAKQEETILTYCRQLYYGE